MGPTASEWARTVVSVVREGKRQEEVEEGYSSELDASEFRSWAGLRAFDFTAEDVLQ